MLSWDNVRRLPWRRPLLLSVMCIWFQSDSKSRRFEGLRTFWDMIIIIITIIIGGKRQGIVIGEDCFLFFFSLFFFNQALWAGGNRNDIVRLWWQLGLLISESQCGMLWPLDDVLLEWQDEIHAYSSSEERLCYICSSQPSCQDVHWLYSGAWIHWNHHITFIYTFINSTYGNNKTNVMMFTIIKDGGVYSKQADKSKGVKHEGTRSINSSFGAIMHSGQPHSDWSLPSCLDMQLHRQSFRHVCESNTFTVTNTSASGETGHCVTSASNHGVVWQDKPTPSNAGITLQDCSPDFFPLTCSC